MMAKLTTRAQKAWRLASEGASKQGRSAFGPLDLLVGVLAEGTGVGAGALKSVGIDLPAFHRELPDYPVLDDPLDTKTLSPNPDAVRVLEEATNASQELGHNYVGSEHLVLGLLTTKDDTLTNAFRMLGVDRDGLRKQVLGLLGRSPPRKPPILDAATVSEMEKLSTGIQETIRQLSLAVGSGESIGDLRERLKELCVRMFQTLDPGP